MKRYERETRSKIRPDDSRSAGGPRDADGEPAPLHFPQATEETSAYGRAIRLLRGKRSQKEVAAAAGLDPTTWSFYETGRRRPKDENRQRVLRGLGCTELELEETAWQIRHERLLQAQEASRRAGDPRFVGTARQLAEQLREEHEELDEGERVDALRRDMRSLLSNTAVLVEEIAVLLVKAVREGNPAAGAGPGGDAA
jgi:transcriptional regulator with XRE-family HTH domain